MKLNYKNTFLGAIVAFFLGTSCCWLSLLAWGLGGVTLIGGLATIHSEIRVAIILFGIVLTLCSIYLYRNRNKLKS